MLKLFVVCLFVVSCRGGPLQSSQEDPEENAYAQALIASNEIEHEMLPSELCQESNIKTIFKLYTEENPNGVYLDPRNNRTLKSSSFNVKRDTKMLFHGWLQNETHSQMKDYISAFLRYKKEQVNVIIVDYGSVSRCEFKSFRDMQPAIAKEVGQLLKSLMEYGSVSSKFHFIGLGMGAQIAGISARQIHPKKVGRLTALDPTFIGYLNDKPQLVSNDSDYMDVMHTALRKMDLVQHLGNARFYPNDGTHQPIGDGKNPIEASVLSHIASALYYLESIIDITYFKAQKCRNWVQFLSNNCPKPIVENFMGEEVNKAMRGNFYLSLPSPVPPFGNREMEVKEVTTNVKVLIEGRRVAKVEVELIAKFKVEYERKRFQEKKYSEEEIQNMVNQYYPRLRRSTVF